MDIDDTFEGDPCDLCESTRFYIDDGVKFCTNGHEQGVRSMPTSKGTDPSVVRSLGLTSRSRKGKLWEMMKTISAIEARSSEKRSRRLGARFPKVNQSWPSAWEAAVTVKSLQRRKSISTLRSGLSIHLMEAMLCLDPWKGSPTRVMGSLFAARDRDVECWPGVDDCSRFVGSQIIQTSAQIRSNSDGRFWKPGVLFGWGERRRWQREDAQDRWQTNWFSQTCGDHSVMLRGYTTPTLANWTPGYLSVSSPSATMGSRLWRQMDQRRRRSLRTSDSWSASRYARKSPWRIP